MLFQQIQKPTCTLSTDFDEFQVELKQLETNLNPQSTEYFLSPEKYYSPIERNSISATVIIDKEQDLEMFFAFSSTFYKTGCHPKYYFTLETETHIFKNGVIKNYDYSLVSGAEFIFEFTEFENKSDENTCESCSA